MVLISSWNHWSKWRIISPQIWFLFRMIWLFHSLIMSWELNLSQRVKSKYKMRLLSRARSLQQLKKSKLNLLYRLESLLLLHLQLLLQQFLMLLRIKKRNQLRLVKSIKMQFKRQLQLLMLNHLNMIMIFMMQLEKMQTQKQRKKLRQ